MSASDPSSGAGNMNEIIGANRVSRQNSAGISSSRNSEKNCTPNVIENILTRGVGQLSPHPGGATASGNSGSTGLNTDGVGHLNRSGSSGVSGGMMSPTGLTLLGSFGMSPAMSPISDGRVLSPFPTYGSVKGTFRSPTPRGMLSPDPAGGRGGPMSAESSMPMSPSGGANIGRFGETLQAASVKNRFVAKILPEFL